MRIDDLAFLILKLAFLLATNIEPIPGSEECRYDGPHAHYTMAGKSDQTSHATLQKLTLNLLAALAPFLPQSLKFQFEGVERSLYIRGGSEVLYYVTICL